VVRLQLLEFALHFKLSIAASVNKTAMMEECAVTWATITAHCFSGAFSAHASPFSVSATRCCLLHHVYRRKVGLRMRKSSNVVVPAHSGLGLQQHSACSHQHLKAYVYVDSFAGCKVLWHWF
jgi:hypothetical protein